MEKKRKMNLITKLSLFFFINNVPYAIDIPPVRQAIKNGLTWNII